MFNMQQYKESCRWKSGSVPYIKNKNKNINLEKGYFVCLYCTLQCTVQQNKISYFFSYGLNNNPADAHKIHAFTYSSGILERAELRETPKSDSAHPTGFHACMLDTNLLSKTKTINAARLRSLQKHVQ